MIDGIAFQTNFLAQRSANAAKEIKGLITASVEKVDSGTSLVGHAGNTMRDIETQIRRVADLIDQLNQSVATFRL